jgi:hypothetical protein
VAARAVRPEAAGAVGPEARPAGPARPALRLVRGGGARPAPLLRTAAEAPAHAATSAARLAAAVGGVPEDQGDGVVSVTFPPPPPEGDAAAPAAAPVPGILRTWTSTAASVLAHEAESLIPGASPSQAPVAETAPAPAPAPAPASPAAAPSVEEITEHVMEELRRQLMTDRERMGDLLGDFLD